MSKQGDDMDFMTTDLMRKYREGKLSAKEKAHLEKLCAEDPFLADALAGLTYTTSGKAFEDNVKALQARLHQKVKTEASHQPRVWQVAALIALLIVAGYGFYAYHAFPPAVEENKESPMASVPSQTSDSGQVIALFTTPAYVEPLPPQPLANEINKEVSRTPAYVQVDTHSSAAALSIADEDIVEQEIPSEQVENMSGSDRIITQSAPAFSTVGSKSVAAETNKSMLEGKIVQGHVVDATNQSPLPGVNVMIKDAHVGTITDMNGKFVLQMPAHQQQLVFSSIGYNTAEINVLQQDSLQIALAPDVQSLSEVVVMGYSPRVKKEVTGAVSSVQADAPKVVRKAEPHLKHPSYKHYIQEHLRYPPEAKAKGIEGVVKVLFTVAADGSLSNFNIKKSLGYGCDEEAIRLIKEGPAWQPATEKGQPIEQRVTIKVKFKLSL